MSKLPTYLIAAALTIAAVSPSRLLAQPTALSPSLWQEFSWVNGASFPVDGDGFTAQSSLQIMRIRVTDAGFNGDAFDIYIDGVPLFSTPGVQGDGYEEQFVTSDPDEAYGNPLLSYFQFFLNPQLDPYLITLTVRESAPDFVDGSGFIQMEEMASPEPGAFVLLATGLFGIAAVKRRRSLQANV